MSTNEEEEADKQASRADWYRVGMWSFLLLFLLVTGLLVYYQFYEGEGRWRFTLLHRTNRVDTAYINQAVSEALRGGQDTAGQQPDGDSLPVPPPPPPEAQHLPAAVDVPSGGVVYTVQIGIFDNYDLRKYKGAFNAMHQEMEGSRTKLTLGEFATHEDATAFARDIKKLGVRDAWVVKFQNGKRVPVKEAAPKKSKKKTGKRRR